MKTESAGNPGVRNPDLRGNGWRVTQLVDSKDVGIYVVVVEKGK